MVVKHRKKKVRKAGYYMRSGLRKRGSGNRGGVGRAGQGKRCKQKKHKFMENGKISYGKHGFTTKKRIIEGVSVGLLCERAEKIGEKKGSKYLINACNKRVLGSGLVNKELIISNYHSITEKAKSKVVKAGGEIVGNDLG